MDIQQNIWPVFRFMQTIDQKCIKFRVSCDYVIAKNKFDFGYDQAIISSVNRMDIPPDIRSGHNLLYKSEDVCLSVCLSVCLCVCVYDHYRNPNGYT